MRRTKISARKAVSTSPTTRRTRWLWPHCVVMATDPNRAIWSFSACSTPSTCRTSYGGCWTKPTANATSQSTRERWMWMSNSSARCSGSRGKWQIVWISWSFRDRGCARQGRFGVARQNAESRATSRAKRPPHAGRRAPIASERARSLEVGRCRQGRSRVPRHLSGPKPPNAPNVEESNAERPSDAGWPRTHSNAASASSCAHARTREPRTAAAICGSLNPSRACKAATESVWPQALRAARTTCSRSSPSARMSSSRFSAVTMMTSMESSTASTASGAAKAPVADVANRAAVTAVARTR